MINLSIKVGGRLMLAWWCTVCCTMWLFAGTPARNEVAFFGRKPVKTDTLHFIKITAEWNWDMDVYYGNSIVRSVYNAIPDTVEMDDGEWFIMRTTVAIPAALVGNTYGIEYKVTGSALFTINGQRALGVGAYNVGRRVPVFEQKGYEFVVLTDTLLHMQVIARVHPASKEVNVSLAMGSAQWAQDQQQDYTDSAHSDYAKGAFFVAFGIVFLLFYLYAYAHLENIFFALFCFCIGISGIMDRFHVGENFDNVANYLFLMGIEFFTLFLAKIVLNKRRKFSMLYIIIFMAFATLAGNVLDIKMPTWVETSLKVLFAVMLMVSSITALVYLIRGVGERKWEAKYIVIGFFAAIIISLVIPIVLAMIYQGKMQALMVHYPILSYIDTIGVLLYPITAAIILGKRSGINEQQLKKQVDEINALSEENKRKEIEKQKILEEQNEQLENKVIVRTQELAMKNEVILQKNKEITDSLLYAKRIQAAILPDKKLLTDIFTDAFVLYKPKDIVSGDFYFIADKEQATLIAAADCTGHGVSGAFMSMIGYSLLNQIINERDIYSPATILDELNIGIINALKQRDGDTRDGMDISICHIDKRTHELTYAGANRPIILIRNGDLMVIGAQKMPIGGLQIDRNVNYKNTNMALLPTDVVYMFTDGYADQFGGPSGKKIMVKKFKEKLHEINNLPLTDQKLILDQFFESWRGNLEQVDDVLVMAIKI